MAGFNSSAKGSVKFSLPWIGACIQQKLQNVEMDEIKAKIGQSRRTTVLALLAIVTVSIIVVLYRNNSEVEQVIDTPAESQSVEDLAKNRKMLNLKFCFNYANVDMGGQIFEFDWISNVLLGKIHRPLRILDANAETQNDTLTVFLLNPPTKTYFEDLRMRGKVNQGAFHMGDEGMGINITFYAKADYVFRNYYNADYLEKYNNTRWVPLGTKSGFGSIEPDELIPSSERKHLCNFVGSIRSNRKEAIETINSRGIKCYLDYEKPWASPDGMKISHYRTLLRESKFTLAPWGYNPESLRFYEALEAGSIPIFQRAKPASKNPLTPLGPDSPIPQFDDWEKAADFILKIEKNPTELNELQLKIVQFWIKFKKKIQTEIREIIDNSFKQAHGFDC